MKSLLLLAASIGMMATPFRMGDVAETSETTDANETSVSQVVSLGDGEVSEVPVEQPENEQEQAASMTEEELTEFLVDWFKSIDWREVFNNITKAEWWDGVLTAIITFLSVNSIAIISLAIKIIFDKTKNAKYYNAFVKVVQDYAKETNQNEREVLDKFEKGMIALDEKITKHINESNKRSETAKALATGTSNKVSEELK